MLRPALVFLFLASGCELAVSLSHFDDGCRPGKGPAPVLVETAHGAYCVDSTEVTKSDYLKFLSDVSSSTPSATPPAGCETVTNFAPKKDWPPPPGTETYPVSQIDWCSAAAYCAWAGKRLCGRIGGGPIATGDNEKDATQSEWFNACSRGGTRAYPYGDTYDANACTGDVGTVGARAGCVGGYDGLHDMSGGVWEWTNACDSSKPDSFCHAAGGAYDSKPDEMACGASPRPWTRSSAANNIGVRCCSDK